MNASFDSKNIRAIIGLGNPGQKYYKNRHNIGFRVVDELVACLASPWRSTELMEYASVRLYEGGPEVFVIKPQTFMNSSGKVVSWLLKKGIKPDQIIVIHDELEKAFGKVLMNFGGSHKGHNGLKSIMGIIGQDFWRLKFGIGRPSDKNEVPDYVLADFLSFEESQIAQLIAQAFQKIKS